MSKMGHDFPSSEAELTIPADVQPGEGWSEQMLEMADHIGAYATLRISERFGGQQVYISANPALNVFRELIGPDKAEIISHVYRRERLDIPTAKYAISRAKRAGLIASVRAKRMTGAEAARILGMSRKHLSHLVNQTDEGTEDGETPRRDGHRIPGQMDLFGDDAE